MSETNHKSSNGLFSFIKKPAYEFIADAPYRVEPKTSLPLVCYANLNRVEKLIVESVSVKIFQDNKTILTTTPLQEPITIGFTQWQKVFIIPLPDELKGVFYIDVFIRIEVDGKIKTVNNNFCQGRKNVPLEVFRARESIPRFEGFYFGDLHFHNYRLVDYYGSGIPLPASSEVAKSVGLDFYAVSLHSFNVNDRGKSSQEDWQRFTKQIAKWNNKNEIKILPAEEISCRNSKGKNIQMLAVNSSEFVVGTGDSPNRLFPVKSEFTLKEAVRQTGNESIRFALHPVLKKPGLRRFFSRKGYWKNEDLLTAGLTGLQIYNTIDNTPDRPGLKSWIELLLKGRRRFIVAGSHATGNLNRQFLRKFPFFGYQKDSRHIFGQVRTGILSEKPLEKDVIINCLKNGKAVVTNGPLFNFVVSNQEGKRVFVGEEIGGEVFRIFYHALSSPEFGPVRKVVFYFGDIKANVEDIIFTFNFSETSFSKKQEFIVEPRSEFGYIRGELWSGDGQFRRYCYTNPVWLRETRAAVENE